MLYICIYRDIYRYIHTHVGTQINRYEDVCVYIYKYVCRELTVC